ncbi:MAG: hypothetical protein I3273_06690 [Candidatus Moeniiplasma glomeromycotorum]|nr:hypothetical protein [Candidatus Moeniiplasma glomeromycotorum]MCE8169772.1 hypothetical protein [Candidatus Moeniiplasma glomeromycotorum]
MKWCNNCYAWKDSWKKRLGSDHPAYKCWSCDKYTLERKTIRLSLFTHLDRSQVRRNLKEVKLGQRNGFTCETCYRDNESGRTVYEAVEYNGGKYYTYKKDGQTEYRELEAKIEVFPFVPCITS